ILVPFPAEIAGVRVAPGAYTLYVIPSATTWEIVVNRSTQRWGTPLSPEVRAQDVGSGQVAVEARPAPAERLRLSFGPVSGNATELIVDWELTRVRIPVRRAEG
ncbi:MAG TPA: DUF2911 domain-containing protein, partial [Gemmatimonadales bacterium]|nr:DUF2911 domain-containing protein [Gemmatimonadales bacterium]